MMKLSIITINFNNDKGLKQTLNSLLVQQHSSVQYIIIDGGSEDMSVTYIKEFEANMTFKNNLIWKSEKDSGIYNAMNKAIKLATAEYCLFINSGDLLHSKNVIPNLINDLDGETDLISGAIQLVTSDNNHIVLYPPNELSLSFAVNDGLMHPNTAIKKTLFDKYGLYNEKNKIVSDWEFFLVVSGLNQASYKKVNYIIASFFQDGISSQNTTMLETERNEVINRLIPQPIRSDILTLNKQNELLSKAPFLLLSKWWNNGNTHLGYNILNLIFKATKKLSK